MDDGDGDTDDDNADNNEEDDDGTTHPSFSLDNLQWIGEKGCNSCRGGTFFIMINLDQPFLMIIIMINDGVGNKK